MAALTSVPVEIVVRILQYCTSFADLQALLLTCRRAHALWAANSPAVIWDVAPRLIPAFDRALMAVRATALVHAAHCDGRLPPDIRPDDISGESRKPDPSELGDVMDLQHLAQCVETRYCHFEIPYGNRWPLDRVPPPPLNTPEQPDGMGIWRERFHAAVYTSLLMGAVFSRAYNQPFHPDAVSASGEEASGCRQKLLNCLCVAQATNSRLRYGGFRVQEKEREYLRRFPVFDLNDKLEGQKETFGPFLDWFIRSAIGKHRAGPLPLSRNLPYLETNAADPTWREWVEAPPRFTEGSPREGEAVLWLLMQSIHVFEFILTCVANSDGQQRLGRAFQEDVPSIPGKKRTAKVVLFGVFQAEEVLMPDDATDPAHLQLLAHTPRSSGTATPLDQAHACLMVSPPILDIPLVLEDLYARSGMPNAIDGKFYAPPPPLQLFTFMLKHHFNLQFAKHVFRTYETGYLAYYYFRTRATIFANGFEQVPDREWADCTDGTDVLTEYQPAALTHRSLSREGPSINPRTRLPWDS